MDRFRGWRAEIVTELNQATGALAAAEAEAASAEADRQAMLRENRVYHDALARHRKDGDVLASALGTRREALREGEQRAQGRVTCAKRTALNARFRIADLQAALQQLDELAPSVPAETELAGLES